MRPNATWVDRQAYPFRSRYQALTAGEMHYIDEGQGDVILLVHGTPTWSFEYRHVVTALSKRYRCIAPDQLGFGLSERPAGFDYTPEAHAAVLGEFVDRLGLDHITLVVHDFGGPIGLPLALRSRPVVDRVVVLNSWAWPIDDDPEMVRAARLVGGAVGRWLYKYANLEFRLIVPSAYGDRRKLTSAILGQYSAGFRDRQSRGQVLHTLATALLGSRAHYQSILDGMVTFQGLPVLIVWGLQDSFFKPHYLARWRQLLPEATVVTLPDAGHWPHEEEPARVIAEIERFLN